METTLSWALEFSEMSSELGAEIFSGVVKRKGNPNTRGCQSSWGITEMYIPEL